MLCGEMRCNLLSGVSCIWKSDDDDVISDDDVVSDDNDNVIFDDDDDDDLTHRSTEIACSYISNYASTC
jgi:hypothetical protein